MFALQLPLLRFPALRTRTKATPAQPIAPVPAPTPAAEVSAAAEVSMAPVIALSHTDPAGVRVVPLRPESSWPERRARDRVSNPFRQFPYRALYLAQMISPDDAGA